MGCGSACTGGAGSILFYIEPFYTFVPAFMTTRYRLHSCVATNLPAKFFEKYAHHTARANLHWVPGRAVV